MAISIVSTKVNFSQVFPSSNSTMRRSLKPAHCSPLQQSQELVKTANNLEDVGIMCEPCKGKGWLLCGFCNGQKTNVKAENNRIYRRCPSCRAIGYVLCSKCKVFKCVTFPNYGDESLPKSKIQFEMEEPSTPSALPSTPTSPSPSASASKLKEDHKRREKVPTPQELVAHYESEGLETKDASMKVIEDLQNVLDRLVNSSRRRKERLMAENSRKLDTVNTRLAILEMKLDSKPGYSESLAIGVASGAIVRGAASVFPHVAGAVGQMWEAVRSTTKT